jgi:hypothetical protein
MDVGMRDDWVEEVRSRGWGDGVLSLLDVIEPVAPLAANALWVCQPVAHLFGMGPVIARVARDLEQLHGTESIRQRLMQGIPADE